MQARRSAVCARASRSCRSRSSSSASAPTTSSRSIPPRTEAPRARSGCTRVARVMATAARQQPPRGVGACARGTGPFLAGPQVCQAQAHEPFAERPAQRVGAGGVLVVHRGDHTEPGGRGDQPDARHDDAPLAEGSEEDVEGVRGQSVGLFQVQQPPLAHRDDQRPVDVARGGEPRPEHGGGVVVAEQRGAGHGRAALDDRDGSTYRGGDVAHEDRLAGARRALDEQVAPGPQGRDARAPLDPASDQGGHRSSSAASSRMICSVAVARGRPR